MAQEQEERPLSEVVKKHEKPDFKLSEMKGKKVTITDCETYHFELDGEDTTFYNVTLDNGKKVSVNENIFEIVRQVKADHQLPRTATFVQKTSKKGRKYFTIE